MRAVLFLLIGCTAASPIAAGELEDRLRSAWHATWVVVDSETASSCDASYTNNSVFEGRVRPRAGHRLPAGELATVHKLSVQRSRIDVLVDLVEPLRVGRVEGPFELYEHARCKVELQFEVDRRLVKERDVEGVEARLKEVLEPYQGRAEAERSPAYNGRRVEPFPAGYDATLAAYLAWREAEVVRELRQRLAQALDEARRIADRARPDAAYSTGFVEGLGAYRERFRSTSCERLPRDGFLPSGGSPPAELSDGDEDDWRDGYRDGQRLAHQLELAERLELCLR